jgi:hypothetical protein
VTLLLTTTMLPPGDNERRKMNLSLPEASAATAAEVRDWLERFAACVREVDYAAARPFWHSDIVIFGTYQELIKSLSAWTERQWDNVLATHGGVSL